MRIEIDSSIIECDIQYGKRKKLLIHIDAIGFITVKAPKNTSEEVIINAIMQNKKWIKEKLDEISKLQERPNTKTYDGQGKFFYLGKEFSLHELINTSGLGEEKLKTNLKKFYISSCKKIVGERIKIYQQQLKVKPKIIEVVESNSQWGSCNSDRKITFNYRLAMCPVEVIDYVIVHELCHLIHMNHDRSFWRRVGSVLADYKKRQEFLTRHGHYMTL
ncbi:MAG: M48 family metallopeptidase [Clostridia bacterium]